VPMVTGNRSVRTIGRAGALLLAVGFWLGCSGATPPQATPRAVDAPVGKAAIGSPAPELVVETLKGKGPKSLAQAKGTVVLVDFWATFCKPCKKVLTEYQQLVADYDGKLAVIAVSVDYPDDVGADQIEGFADALGLSFSIVWDDTETTVSRYDPPDMPTSYLIDQQGVLRQIYRGSQDADPKRIRADVDALLRQQP
jgi:thiol-disulfide isomerase/thioredoxin